MYYDCTVVSEPSYKEYALNIAAPRRSEEIYQTIPARDDSAYHRSNGGFDQHLQGGNLVITISSKHEKSVDRDVGIGISPTRNQQPSDPDLDLEPQSAHA